MCDSARQLGVTDDIEGLYNVLFSTARMTSTLLANIKSDTENGVGGGSVVINETPTVMQVYPKGSLTDTFKAQIQQKWLEDGKCDTAAPTHRRSHPPPPTSARLLLPHPSIPAIIRMHAGGYQRSAFLGGWRGRRRSGASWTVAVAPWSGLLALTPLQLHTCVTPHPSPQTHTSV